MTLVACVEALAHTRCTRTPARIHTSQIHCVCKYCLFIVHQTAKLFRRQLPSHSFTQLPLNTLKSECVTVTRPFLCIPAAPVRSLTLDCGTVAQHNHSVNPVLYSFRENKFKKTFSTHAVSQLFSGRRLYEKSNLIFSQVFYSSVFHAEGHAASFIH